MGWREVAAGGPNSGRPLLGLFQSTAVEVARGELGWLSLKARRDIKQLKYWGRPAKMADFRLVKKVYTYCKDYTATQKGSFCYSVKNILGQLNLQFPVSLRFQQQKFCQIQQKHNIPVTILSALRAVRSVTTS